MLPNEVFALECLARYAKEGLVVDSSNGQFAHCPYPKPREQKYKLPDDLGYWLTFFDHQHQGLLQSVDVGRKCYFAPDVKLYLDTYPPNYFELYDIYDKFNLHTGEAKKNMSKVKSGEKHPNYGKFGATHSGSKAIIVIKPDGTQEHYESMGEAARKLKTHRSNLHYFINNGQVRRWGKFKGCQFFYAVKE